MKLLPTLATVLLLSPAAGSSGLTTFCDLLRTPDMYNQKTVRVRATYRSGFEWSELFCLDCEDKGLVWMKRPIELDETSARELKKLRKGAGIVNLTVDGVFESGETYGHSNGYRYQLTPTRIRNVVVIQNGTMSWEKEREAIKRWACGGTDPK